MAEALVIALEKGKEKKFVGIPDPTIILQAGDTVTWTRNPNLLPPEILSDIVITEEIPVSQIKQVVTAPGTYRIDYTQGLNPPGFAEVVITEDVLESNPSDFVAVKFTEIGASKDKVTLVADVTPLKQNIILDNELWSNFEKSELYGIGDVTNDAPNNQSNVFFSLQNQSLPFKIQYSYLKSTGRAPRAVILDPNGIPIEDGSVLKLDVNRYHERFLTPVTQHPSEGYILKVYHASFYDETATLVSVDNRSLINLKKLGKYIISLTDCCGNTIEIKAIVFDSEDEELCF